MRRVLVACEFSGIVRDAFAAQKRDAWSCDLLPTKRPGQHVMGPVEPLLDRDKDRAKIRSRAYTGIAQAMASQWGHLPPPRIP
jgi:hypothetical protein